MSWHSRLDLEAGLVGAQSTPAPEGEEDTFKDRSRKCQGPWNCEHDSILKKGKGRIRNKDSK